MMHLDEGVLQAFADGELPPETAREVERHLVECAACARELTGLRAAARELSGALALLDRPAPRSGYAVAVPRSRARRDRGGWGGGWGALPRAAVLVLGFAAAASATIPGSPVRDWIEGMWEPEPAAERAALESPAAVEAAAVEVEAPEAGVSVAPAQGSVQVILREASPELRIRAVIAEGGRAGVFATGAAAGARFSTAPGRIEVTGAGPGELRIELPRVARSATVVINGDPYLSKEGDQLRLSVPGEDTAAAEISFGVRRP